MTKAADYTFYSFHSVCSSLEYSSVKISLSLPAILIKLATDKQMHNLMLLKNTSSHIVKFIETVSCSIVLIEDLPVSVVELKNCPWGLGKDLHHCMKGCELAIRAATVEYGRADTFKLLCIQALICLFIDWGIADTEITLNKKVLIKKWEDCHLVHCGENTDFGMPFNTVC